MGYYLGLIKSIEIFKIACNNNYSNGDKFSKLQ